MPTDELREVATLRTVGDYDLLSKIADGGMGSVYKARNNLTNDIVAIKIVPANMANNTVLLNGSSRSSRLPARWIIPTSFVLSTLATTIPAPTW